MSNPFLEFFEKYGAKAGERGPLLFVLEVLGATPDEWQERVLLAYGRLERRISIRSCHGPGKTALAAWLVVYNLACRFPQNTVATAPTGGQLYDALFKEVKVWLGRLPEAVQGLFDVTAKRIELRAAPEESFFSARTSRAEKPEALQGIHCEGGHVLLIADEASGVPESIFEAAAGSMSGHNATTLLLSNPVRTSGFFFDTHHRLRDMWFTAHVSHKDSARVSDDFIRDIARRYGEDSNAYRVRCLGEFPKSDLDTVIPYELVIAAQEREIVVNPFAPEVWGIDIARQGDDMNALVRRKGKVILPDILTWRSNDLMQTSGRIKALWDQTMPSQRPQEILIDEIGLGAGVVDRLRELKLPVRGINVAEAASISERYRNLRSELWFKGREWLAAKNCQLPPSSGCADDPAEQLGSELVIPKYTFTSSGKLAVEGKLDMKKRGYPSPNIADAFLLTLAVDYVALAHGSTGSSSWSEPIKRNRAGVV